MRMTRTMTSALVIAAIAVSTPVVAASSAAAVTCTSVGQNFLFGRVLTKGDCDGRFHGQIENASPGDSVDMQYVAGMHTFSFGLTFVQPGSRSANSASIDRGGKACVYIGDRPGESVCV